MTNIAKFVDRSDMAVVFWAKAIMEEHGLISAGWKFRINGRIRRTLGICNQTRKEICLSRVHVERDVYEQILDTMLHEVAHALVGCKYGHGPVWQQMAIKLGAVPSACKNTSLDIEKNDTVIPVILCYHKETHYFACCISEKRFNQYHEQEKNINTTWITGKKWTRGKLGIYKLTVAEVAKLPKLEDIK